MNHPLIRAVLRRPPSPGVWALSLVLVSVAPVDPQIRIPVESGAHASRSTAPDFASSDLDDLPVEPMGGESVRAP